MPKRGVKKYEESTNSKLLPLRIIAQQLGISERTAWSDYRSAMNKLRVIPGAFEILLESIHAVDTSEKDPLQATSLECRPEFVKLFSSPDAKIKKNTATKEIKCSLPKQLKLNSSL